MFPGEQSAIDQVIALAEKYGYGNLIGHLQRAWSQNLQDEYDTPKEIADKAAMILEAWSPDLSFDDVPKPERSNKNG